jgi:putative transposase
VPGQNEPKGELRQLSAGQCGKAARQHLLGCLFVVFVVADVKRCYIFGEVVGVNVSLRPNLRRIWMKKKRFSVEQIVGVLKQAEVGVPVAEVIRKAGISEQTFYRWKAKYSGLEVDQVRQMAQLQEENMRLKQLVAELTLDKAMLQDVLSKKW